MRQRDLSGHDLVVVGYVGGRVLGAVLELDGKSHPELLKVHVASFPIDADPPPDLASLCILPIDSCLRFCIERPGEPGRDCKCAWFSQKSHPFQHND